MVFVLIATACAVTETASNTAGTATADDIVGSFSVDRVRQVGSASTQSDDRRAVPPALGEPAIRVLHPDPLSLSTSAITLAVPPALTSLSKLMAERFNEDGFIGEISVLTTTTETPSAVCSAERVLILALEDSPTASDFTKCSDADQVLLSFMIGRDRLVPVTHPENFWAEGLTSAQLDNLLDAPQWSTASEAFARRPVNTYLPRRGTNAFEILAEGRDYTALERLSRLASQSSLPRQELVPALIADPNGLALLTLGQVAAHEARGLAGPGPQTLTLDGFDARTSIDYPLERNLHLVVSRQTLREVPDAASFVAFYLNESRNEMLAHGVFPLTADETDQVRRRLNDLLILEPTPTPRPEPAQ